MSDKTPAEKWVAALRSGDYAQARGALRDEDRFCCLGVACDVYAQQHPGSRWDGNTFRVGSSRWAVLLPESVIDWLGLRTHDGMFVSGEHVDTLTGEHVDTLTNLNDKGKSFAEIADVIESRPTRLFEDAA